MKNVIRVLYVDDYQPDRALVRRALETEPDDFRLTEVTSRLDFETLLSQGEYDVVLTNFNILGFEGLQVLDTVQAQNPDIPVIIVTGTGSEEIAVEAMKQGASDYVIKSSRHVQRLPHTIRAVLERQHLREECEKTKQALTESEEKFRAIFRGSLDVILIVDIEEGIILKANDAVDRILGYDEEALIGQPFSLLFPPTFSSLTREEMIEEIQSADSILESQPFLRADGSVCPMDLTLTLIPWGQRRAILITLRDVTERRLVEEEIRRLNSELEQRVRQRTRQLAAANERLKELDRLKSKFVSDVSHELRTPVTNLGLYLSLIEHGSAEKQAHYRSVLKQQVSRLEQLVEDILDLSRLARQLEMATFVPVDLNSVAATVVNAQLHHAQAADLSLTFIPFPDLPAVRGDRDQLVQVTTNLVNNAIKYTLEGHVEVETGLVAARDRAYLSVTDSGIGVSAEDLPHLFERFYRGKHTAYVDVPGTGLGLSIVNEIVEFHGGEVEVESKKGEGSTFRVLLPLAEGTNRVPTS